MGCKLLMSSVINFFYFLRTRLVSFLLYLLNDTVSIIWSLIMTFQCIYTYILFRGRLITCIEKQIISKCIWFWLWAIWTMAHGIEVCRSNGLQGLIAQVHCAIFLPLIQPRKIPSNHIWLRIYLGLNWTWWNPTPDGLHIV